MYSQSQIDIKYEHFYSATFFVFIVHLRKNSSGNFKRWISSWYHHPHNHWYHLDGFDPHRHVWYHPNDFHPYDFVLLFLPRILSLDIALNVVVLGKLYFSYLLLFLIIINIVVGNWRKGRRYTQIARACEISITPLLGTIS